MVEAQDRAAVAVRRKRRAQRYPASSAPDISEIIRESIDYGLTHRDEAVAYSLAYARDMNSQLANKFIGMYVNGLPAITARLDAPLSANF